jgi:KDO2-lipid IV(A) lauroyltransferase
VKARREHRIRWVFEAGLFRLALRLIPLLPRQGVVGLARFLGRMAWWADRRDRRVALANLDLAFGDGLSPAQKRAIARQVFQNFAQTTLDYFWFSRDRAARLARYVTMDESMAAWFGKGAVVAVTAHFGNWEVLGQIAAVRGAPLHSVAKPIKNPAIDKQVNRLREESGQRIIARDGALRSLVKVLRDNGVVALILDQDTRESEGGVFVPFFGVPAPVSSAAAGLAAKFRAPILPVFCRNEGRGRYRCYAREALRPAALEGQSAEAITARIAAVLEAEIKADPAQWLWTYKRWKRRQPGVDVSRYPFYADS